jgi:hypothetical protein
MTRRPFSFLILNLPISFFNLLLAGQRGSLSVESKFRFHAIIYTERLLSCFAQVLSVYQT